jgi:hypothetical protein
MEQARKTTALFIDADNVRVTAIPLILEILTPEWLPIKMRAYGTQMRQKQRLLRDNGVMPVEIVPVQPGKDSADLTMIIDAMEELYCGQAHSIAIASGDSDFTPLALKIRERGKPVLVFGHSFTPLALRKAATKFHCVGWFQQEPDGEVNSFDRLRSRMADLINEIGNDQEQVTLVRLSGTIGQRDPIFTPKKYGCKSSSTLLVKLGFTLTVVKDKKGAATDYVVMT